MRYATGKWSLIGLMLALSLALGTLAVQAQEESAVAGNAGTADCAANGGAAALGDVNSGANAGSTVGVGDTWGDVAVDGGAMSNSTDVTVAGDGGTGICDASGGDANLGLNIEPPPPPEPDRDNDRGNNRDNNRDNDRGNDRDNDPDEPEEEFQVCVILIGGDEVCGAGECTGPAGDAECTVEDCSDIPGFPSPCTFDGCTVEGNTGTCVIVPEPV